VCLFGAIVWLIFMGLGMVQKGELAVGELFNFMLLTAFVGASIGGLAEQFVQIQKTLGAIDRVLDIIDSPAEGNSANQNIPQNAQLAIQNVEFAYSSRPNNSIIKDISFSLKPGTTTALVGPSGSGKTTITALLYQFYHPLNGKVTLNEIDAANFNLHDYRSQFALVPQEVILFGGSILENIAYGNPKATLEEIHQAAKDAFCWDFINDFPDKFNTEVGDRGMKLSGGQKQRIAIARAILKNPAILLLDEATSALDAESERLVQEALNNLMEGRTSLIIAHRLATIREADNILVLDGGKIVESGRHDQLMNNENGLYRQLALLQFEER
jgi:ABC-type multidrug transport system fused ATPase/permease subunit